MAVLHSHIRNKIRTRATRHLGIVVAACVGLAAPLTGAASAPIASSIDDRTATPIGNPADDSAAPPIIITAGEPDVPVWTPPQALRRVRTGGLAAPLPEGVVLLRAVGELRPGALKRSWTFEPEEPEGMPRRTLTVLPSGALEDAAQRLEAMGGGARLRVELTGTVQLYRGRNFVLAGMVTPLVPHRLDQSGRPGRPEGRVPDVDALEADEIERRLRERLGPVPRGTGGTWRDGDADDSAWMPTEGRVIRRRGTVRRDDETGGWRFVPETESHADATEVAEVRAPADSTMGLLPCRMLERIERVARSADVPPSLLISGEVVRFGERTFLLPTALESPRTGRSLRPGGVKGG